MRTREAIEQDLEGSDELELMRLLLEITLDIRDALVDLVELVAAEPEA